MANIFHIDFERLAKFLLPISLRKVIIKAFLNAFIKPVKTLYKQFNLFRLDKNQQISYNAQVCSMRKMLNDIFDPAQRRITIAQAAQRTHLMLYRREEEKPVMFGVHLVNRRDLIEYRNEFTVNIPICLQDREIEIRAKINYYKLATKQYIIKYF
ncbi:MAG: hypothetical protein FWD87_11035 [Spirochaetaceae bacterium]|nr:hypothetical protein [Spirochaetaceae bacterium]